MEIVGVWLPIFGAFLGYFKWDPKRFFSGNKGASARRPPITLSIHMIADSLSQILKSAENNGLFMGFQVEVTRSRFPIYNLWMTRCF